MADAEQYKLRSRLQSCLSHKCKPNAAIAVRVLHPIANAQTCRFKILTKRISSQCLFRDKKMKKKTRPHVPLVTFFRWLLLRKVYLFTLLRFILCLYTHRAYSQCPVYEYLRHTSSTQTLNYIHRVFHKISFIIIKHICEILG